MSEKDIALFAICVQCYGGFFGVQCIFLVFSTK